MARTAFIDAGPSLYPVGVTYAGEVYHHEKGRSADGQPFAWFIETADTYLDPDSRLLVRGVWPDFKDQAGPVALSITARGHPQNPEQSVASAAMAPGDAKADVLISGRLFKVRFAGTGAPTACRIGQPLFEVARAGQR
jgi:hypothetical protein